MSCDFYPLIVIRLLILHKIGYCYTSVNCEYIIISIKNCAISRDDFCELKPVSDEFPVFVLI